jgi:hypothetical protein
LIDTKIKGAKNDIAKQRKTSALIAGDANYGFIVKNIHTAQQSVIILTKMYLAIIILLQANL